VLEAITFWILAAGAILGAAAVVLPPFGRNPIHAALALVTTLFFLAGLFVMLSASFLAAMQVLVYAGAILVLFIFVIMLLNLRGPELGEARITGVKVASAFAALLLVGKLAKTAWTAGAMPAAPLPAGEEEFGGVHGVAELLFRQFLLPFELVSVLLLVAVIVAVAVARRRFGRGVE